MTIDSGKELEQSRVCILMHQRTPKLPVELTEEIGNSDDKPRDGKLRATEDQLPKGIWCAPEDEIPKGGWRSM